MGLPIENSLSRTFRENEKKSGFFLIFFGIFLQFSLSKHRNFINFGQLWISPRNPKSTTQTFLAPLAPLKKNLIPLTFFFTNHNGFVRFLIESGFPRETRKVLHKLFGTPRSVEEEFDTSDLFFYKS